MIEFEGRTYRLYGTRWICTKASAEVRALLMK